jgi:protocatechuate 3,4-dioxygenase alpha subunit
MSKPDMITSPFGTIGPYFPYDFVDGCEDLTQCDGLVAQGRHISISGRVLEEGCRPTKNTILEIWQADANGIFRHPLDPRCSQADPGFAGWGRARTDAQGNYQFRTVIPGSYTDEKGSTRCPHINVMLLAIGLTRRLVTTIFFADEPALVSDPVLDCVPPNTRSRLFAVREESLDSGGLQGYRFDVILRGEDETPFFLD